MDRAPPGRKEADETRPTRSEPKAAKTIGGPSEGRIASASDQRVRRPG